MTPCVMPLDCSRSLRPGVTSQRGVRICDVARLGAHGAELMGEVAQYENK
jgi:hypothetical protein